MPPYDDWNKVEDDDEEELQDTSFFESRKDVILFCIDCSESMLELRNEPNSEDIKTCHLFTALEAAMQIQKRKIIVGPNDSVGIMLFNTIKKLETGRVEVSELKRNTFVFQPLSPLSAPKIQELIQLLDAARENPNELRDKFPPLIGKRIPTGDVFTSCNWVFRDGAPKTATKRVFLITDEDNPHPGTGTKQLITSARTTLDDLIQAGVSVEPFFISTDDKPFNTSTFYSQILLPINLEEDDTSVDTASILPESISISRVGDLLNQMRIREIPKRSLFSIPFQLAEGFTIGIKGYGLVTEQKIGSYKYFVDLGDRMEVAISRTVYVDEDHQADVDKAKILFGADQGASASKEDDDDEDDDENGLGFGAKATKVGQRPFYTAEEIQSFRTLGLEPGIKLLGFKNREELRFEDNIKHSHFIYPDEMAYSGSKRTFSALLNSMIKKKKIGLALVLTRRNATPIFCALLPQAEHIDKDGFTEPPGIHLIPLPFADDIRAAPIQEAFRASDHLKNAARAWIDKLSVKNGTYPPDSYPNPALAYHNAQLQASAFREEFDPDSFEDLTEPNIGVIHKRAGSLMKEWKLALLNDDTANVLVPITGSKRKADLVDETEIRSLYERGALGKLVVDQLRQFLKTKSQPSSGKKAELIERVTAWLSSH